MSEALFAAMQQSIVDGDEEQAPALARQALAAGIDPLAALERGFVPGVQAVGEQFGYGQAFLPELILAGEAMKAAVAVLEPALQAAGVQRPILGRVVLGTVQGDIHEIGKTLVGAMLTANGFQVFDLGVDVPIGRFVEKARQVAAAIVGVSALLTTTMAGQQGVVRALAEAGLRPRVKVMVGGAPASAAWAAEIGADGYAADAVAAVVLARRLVAARAED